MMTMTLPARIQAALDRSGMNQRELAAALNMNEATVSLWLSGGRTPRMKNLEKLAKVLGIEARELWSGPEATPATEVQAQVLQDMAHLTPTQQETIAALVRSMRADK